MPTPNKPPTMQTFSNRKVPAAAFTAEIGSFQFTAGEEQDGKTTFHQLARSSKPVKHWYWGELHHDFEGMQLGGDSIPVDYCHREDEVLGYADRYEVKADGLHLSGALVHQHKGDRVDQVTHKGKNGVPYQASIDFRDPETVIEEVREGFTAQVNGQTVEGPALIFRKWTLRGMAICPYGRDRHTATQFSEDEADAVDVRIYTTEGEMTKPTSDNKPAEQQSETTASSDAPTGGTDQQQSENPPKADEQQSQSENPADPPQQQADDPAGDGETLQQYKNKLKAFTTQFGADLGLKWCEEGITENEALKRFSQHQAEQVKAANEERDQYKSKLERLGGGEEIPAQQSESDNDDTGADIDPRFAHLGPNLGRVASKIQVPKS